MASLNMYTLFLLNWYIRVIAIEQKSKVKREDQERKKKVGGEIDL